jgi:hypothetical protein
VRSTNTPTLDAHASQEKKIAAIVSRRFSFFKNLNPDLYKNSIGPPHEVWGGPKEAGSSKLRHDDGARRAVEREVVEAAADAGIFGAEGLVRLRRGDIRFGHRDGILANGDGRAVGDLQILGKRGESVRRDTDAGITVEVEGRRLDLQDLIDDDGRLGRVVSLGRRGRLGLADTEDCDCDASTHEGAEAFFHHTVRIVVFLCFVRCVSSSRVD